MNTLGTEPIITGNAKSRMWSYASRSRKRAGVIECDFASLEPNEGDPLVLELKVKVDRAAPTGAAALSNTATVSAQTPDDDPDDNTSTVVTDVTEPPAEPEPEPQPVAVESPASDNEG